MSFILDALRKSEAERQQQAGGEFSNVPSSSGDDQSPKWLWMLALLLLVNIAVLLGILLRPDAAPEAETPAATAPASSAPVASMPIETAPAETPPAEAATAQPEAPVEPSFEDRVAQAIEDQPPPEPVDDDAAAPVASDPAPAIVAPSPDQERLQTLDELRLAGAVQLPELHLDIHVFAEQPAERFVFINMNKHREGSRLDEGPVVVEITSAGVVLQHQGRTFLLPRE
ncbi:MAG: general secretion pathway protein GspB [Woeseiaceae bacterium]|nr:general secretion pathway protein GspB [Woeseiaceae bacterium]